LARTDQPDGERLVDALAARLTARPSARGAEIVGWRFSLTVGWALRAGLRDDELGGPYEPPAAAQGTGGRLYARWSDGTVSHGDLDSAVVDELPERLAEWRANAYLDPDAPEILPPAPLPLVQTADSNVEDLVEGQPLPLLELLGRTRQELAAAGLGRLQAEAGAWRGQRWVFNSRGLRAQVAETSASFAVSAEELYSAGFGKRRLPREHEVATLLNDVAAITSLLRTTVEPPSGSCPVLLAPNLAMSLVGSYLVGNLVGSRVLSSRGAYRLGDFREGWPVARHDLDLLVDSTLDLEGAASPVSAEGVPGGRAKLIRRGRLVRPLVDLKYAARTGYPPTPVPGGSPGFLLQSAAPWRLVDEVRTGLDSGLELFSVLGLHTQDAATGHYSLVAPRALIFRGGQPTGRAKVSLGGSFFAHLLDERTELVAYPGELNPGLLVWTNVQPRA
jgi:PmbA protein